MRTSSRRRAPVAAAAPGRDPIRSRLTVVGLGASAGGLEAFTRLLEHLPANTGNAFVFVQHLDPTHESYLPDLLSRATKMPVVEARDGLAVRHDRVYVMPSNVRMSIAGEVLKLQPRRAVAGPHLPIDDFFRSMAEGGPSLAIGVVLSGAGTDGTLGLKAIKSSGGVTFAQDPKSAKHDGMPRSAIASGCVDFVLPPEEIAREMITVGAHPFWGNSDMPVSVDSLAESPAKLDRILDMVRASSGVDFTYYKRTTIQRRIARRLVIHKLERLDDYVKFLRENPAEINALFQDILIHVTSFFRERASFALLKKRVFPMLMKSRARNEPVRVWVPGCSTGEEAYSIAITLHEFLETRSPSPRMQVFASDISESAIEQARLGFYAENVIADVSRVHLRKFFVKVDSRYQISKTIRDSCIFAKQDVAKDPPFSRLDLISCRNVLIYLGPVLQKKVIPIFHYALKPGGFLVLGAAESIGRYSDLFQVCEKKHQIYIKKQVPYALDYMAAGGEVASDPARPRQGIVAEEVRSAFDVHKEADKILLARYAPAGVLVDEQMDILQFRGHTGPYLEPAPGAASLNLMKMARRGLWSDVRLAIRKARKEDATVRKEGLSVELGDEVRNVDIEVIPIRRVSSKPSAFMVLFTEKAARKPVEAEPRAEPQRKRTTARDGSREMRRLKQELEATREYLQAVIDTQQATNEELKTANEEILSSNEELQSTNEELETAKEELQSTNEELTTLNEELRTRNAEAAEALSDLNNVLNSADIPLVLLASDLTIRRINPPAESHLNLRATDVGRSIREIRLRLDAPGLEEMINRVVESALPLEMEAKDPDGHPYMMRVNPYRDSHNKIEGVVLRAIELGRAEATLA